DPDRATSLMRAYYKRSEEANLYFSDFNGEGWMSDRGLVYIVFGPPSRVVLDGNKEIWFFNSEQAEYGLQMVFSHGAKVRLDRSLDYKQSWYLTVDGWRNGKVSNL
ncbi:MAG: GWxTD domain-containing protein, partial [Bacteroidetes bacterium]|nr:GWxTD domain-containing protein [Bacteroidota bacterium]